MLFDDGHNLRQIGASQPPGLRPGFYQTTGVFTQPRWISDMGMNRALAASFNDIEVAPQLDLAALGFAGVVPEVTGRPSYHPATPLRLFEPGSVEPAARTGKRSAT